MLFFSPLDIFPTYLICVSLQAKWKFYIIILNETALWEEEDGRTKDNNNLKDLQLSVVEDKDEEEGEEQHQAKNGVLLLVHTLELKAKNHTLNLKVKGNTLNL